MLSQSRSSIPSGPLRKAKIISPGQLQAGLDAQNETYELLGEILMQQGAITREELARAIQVQIYETFYVIFQWKDGSYQFNLKDIKAKSPLYQLINIQSILLDVLRMIDEWPDVKRYIPSFDIIFQPVAGSFPAELADDGLLVYNLIDGVRTVQQIIDETLMGTFTTAKILSELLQAGYIAKTASGCCCPGRAAACRNHKIFRHGRSLRCSGAGAGAAVTGNVSGEYPAAAQRTAGAAALRSRVSNAAASAAD